MSTEALDPGPVPRRPRDRGPTGDRVPRRARHGAARGRGSRREPIDRARAWRGRWRREPVSRRARSRRAHHRHRDRSRARSSRQRERSAQRSRRSRLLRRPPMSRSTALSTAGGGRPSTTSSSIRRSIPTPVKSRPSPRATARRAIRTMPFASGRAGRCRSSATAEPSRRSSAPIGSKTSRMPQARMADSSSRCFRAPAPKPKRAIVRIVKVDGAGFTPAAGLILHEVDGRNTEAAEAVLRHALPLNLSP